MHVAITVHRQYYYTVHTHTRCFQQNIIQRIYIAINADTTDCKHACNAGNACLMLMHMDWYVWTLSTERSRRMHIAKIGLHLLQYIHTHIANW